MTDATTQLYRVGDPTGDTRRIHIAAAADRGLSDKALCGQAVGLKWKILWGMVPEGRDLCGVCVADQEAIQA